MAAICAGMKWGWDRVVMYGNGDGDGICLCGTDGDGDRV